MTWGRMDDKFHRNRKVRELRSTKAGRAALGDWAFWWSWCLDDPSLSGVIPHSELSASDKKSSVHLVSVGLWEEVPEGFRFHDFHEYNPTSEQREAKKTADRERVAKSRNASRENVARDSQKTRERVASTRVPIPSHPIPIPSQSESAHEEVMPFDVPAEPPPLPPRTGMPPMELARLIESTYSEQRAAAWLKAHSRPGGAYKRGPKDYDSMQHAVEFFAEQSDQLADSVAGYMSDRWAIDARWPFGTWARDPGKYMGLGGVHGASKLDALRAEERAAAEAFREAEAVKDRTRHDRREEVEKVVEARRVALMSVRDLLRASEARQ
jgi:hypothetical protein